MTSSDAAQVVRAARKAGMSLEGIADRVGCTTTTLYTWLKAVTPTRVHRLFVLNLRALRDELTEASK